MSAVVKIQLHAIIRYIELTRVRLGLQWLFTIAEGSEGGYSEELFTA